MTVAIAFASLFCLLAAGLTVPVALGLSAGIVAMMAAPTVIVFIHLFSNTIGNLVGDWILVAVILYVFYGRLCAEFDVRPRLAATISALFGASPRAALAGEILAGLVQPDCSGDVLVQRNDDAAATTNRLQQAGVPAATAIGVSGALASIRLLMPLSVFLVVAAILTQISIAQLFLALAPIMIGAGLLLWLIAAIRVGGGSGRRDVEGSTSAFVLVWVLVPVLLLGLIAVGQVTPGEAGAIGVGLAIIIGAIERRLSIKYILRASLDTLQDSGAIILALAFSMVLLQSLAIEGSYTTFTSELRSTFDAFVPAIGLLFCVLIILIATTLLGPLIALFVVIQPLSIYAVSVGVDPIRFTLMGGAAIAMGLMIPPCGPTFATLIMGSTVDRYRATASLMKYSIVILLVLLTAFFAPFLLVGAVY